MKSLVIHAAKDLRIEETDPGALEPGQVDIAIEAGGICGSDLHYYNHGGFGAIRLREPMILGHEVAGTIRAVGEGVSCLADRRSGCGLAEPAVQCLPLLPEGSAEPMPQHALLRQRHADAAYPGSIPPTAGRRSLAVPPDSRPRLDQRGRLRRAVRGYTARRQPGGLAVGQAGSRHRLRADRGALHHRRPRARRTGNRRNRCDGRRSGNSRGNRRRPHDQCRDRRRQAGGLQRRKGIFRRDV